MSNTFSQTEAVAAIRHFSRFYTNQLNLLGEGLLKSDFSLTEARILYELAHREALSAADLCRDLRLDAGYLSRILKSFDQRGLIARVPSPNDGRQSFLSLTRAGRSAFDPLERASQEEIRSMTGQLSSKQMTELVRAMRTIEGLMADTGQEAVPVILRRHKLGDLGWIARRQAILYAMEYGWDETYEALAAEILAGFVKQNDPEKEQSWIAERDGEIVGSVFLMHGSDSVGKLRLLYVEPSARGIGLGRKLTDACIDFARHAGYQTLTLWTNDVLVPARRIYDQAGFACVATEPHRSFGQDLVGETWNLTL